MFQTQVHAKQGKDSEEVCKGQTDGLFVTDVEIEIRVVLGRQARFPFSGSTLTTWITVYSCYVRRSSVLCRDGLSVDLRSSWRGGCRRWEGRQVTCRGWTWRLGWNERAGPGGGVPPTVGGEMLPALLLRCRWLTGITGRCIPPGP